MSEKNAVKRLAVRCFTGIKTSKDFVGTLRMTSVMCIVERF